MHYLFLKKENESIEKKRDVIVNIIKKGDKFLILKSSETDEWEVPKGKVEENEKIIDACIRETYEETGLKIKVKNIKSLGKRETQHYIWHYFFTVANNARNKIKLSDEHVAYKWIKFEEFKNYNLADEVKDVLKEFRRLLK